MKTILLVEDDPSIQDAMQLIFDKSEFHLIICSNVEELQLENMLVPDLYLIDKQLSGGDGLEICRTLKANEKTKSVSVIMLSASPNIKHLAAEAGADGSIEKPFKIAHLLEQVHSALT